MQNNCARSIGCLFQVYTWSNLQNDHFDLDLDL